MDFIVLFNISQEIKITLIVGRQMRLICYHSLSERRVRKWITNYGIKAYL